MASVRSVLPQSRLLTKGDILLIAIIIAASVGLWINLFLSSNDSQNAEIYFENKLIKTLSLNQDTQYTINKDGVRILIEVEDKKIRMKESNCPRKICVHQGWIRKSGESIICVPNKVVVKINGAWRMFRKLHLCAELFQATSLSYNPKIKPYHS